MAEKKLLSDEELMKSSGGASKGVVYVAIVLRGGVDEEEVGGEYDSKMEAFDAACEKVQELMRITPERTYIVKVYLWDKYADIKGEVYTETITVDDYYKKI